ncbi:MAG: hypothetical protein EOP48_19200 [Sphingobacteriales bacterium]|nr:MAG: hypothetical protein EOP48_19200 [Sphingobacteriales bacterium]
MFSWIILLAITLFLSQCTTTDSLPDILLIQTENRLPDVHGIRAMDPDGVVKLDAYSYPSSYKFYTDEEIVRIVAATCDAGATAVRVNRLEADKLTIDWNFTVTGQNESGLTAQGLPKFQATLTEPELGKLRIDCYPRES